MGIINDKFMFTSKTGKKLFEKYGKDMPIIDYHCHLSPKMIAEDYKFRNAAPEFTFKLWESVRQNEDNCILPFSDDCDIILNSLMPYEISMLKPYVIPLLSEISENSVYFAYASEMLKRFEDIEEISREYIPSISVYREFLG